MSNESLPLITSFVIRIISEAAPESAAATAWRGAIRHIQTDQELTFTHWKDALAFMQQFLPATVFDTSEI